MISIHIKEAGYTQGKPVINNIEFSLPPGQLIGLIGANGAGKSTTIQSMMGTIPYFQGDIQIDTYGYVPERPILYEYYTLWEHIDLLIRTVGQEENELKQQAKALCKAFRLEDKLHDYPIHFSKGMQQKVMLVLALTPIYELYILDEPFMGLDPQAIRKLIELIEDYKGRGAAILMSTHALDTAEKICDGFICMHDGAILKQGALQALQQYEGQPLLDIFDELIAGVTDGII
ncbi:ABC transporter ATP-binding protein [Lysinibacillus sp. KU-BSD001]|uniref:ABC transporter ATP-binding protein n=1 Tax=Lysinibacillus sp. KU-BSD001 TaxID=3141328 RepID=UPI0036EE222A